MLFARCDLPECSDSVAETQLYYTVTAKNTGRTKNTYCSIVHLVEHQASLIDKRVVDA